MSSENTTTYELTIYAADFRWDGQVDIPSFRRPTDYLNDSTVGTILLNDVSASTWKNETLRDLRKADSIAVLKRNALVIIPRNDAPRPADAKFEQIKKIPHSVMIHLPAHTVIGNVSLLPHMTWLNLLVITNQEFFPVTKASVWRSKSGTQLETNLPFLLVNRQEIAAMELLK